MQPESRARLRKKPSYWEANHLTWGRPERSRAGPGKEATRARRSPNIQLRGRKGFDERGRSDPYGCHFLHIYICGNSEK